MTIFEQIDQANERLTELAVSKLERAPALGALMQGWLVIVRPLGGIRVIQCVDPVTRLVHSKPIV